MIVIEYMENGSLDAFLRVRTTFTKILSVSVSREVQYGAGHISTTFFFPPGVGWVPARAMSTYQYGYHQASLKKEKNC